MFRSAFKRTRCLIPASGYYEWKAMPDGKQPFYITASDGSVLSFAGLWDEWRNPETGEPLKSATIIVTAANKLTGEIHDRMPSLLRRNSSRGFPVQRARTFYSLHRRTRCACGRCRTR